MIIHSKRVVFRRLSNKNVVSVWTYSGNNHVSPIAKIIPHNTLTNQQYGETAKRAEKKAVGGSRFIHTLPPPKRLPVVRSSDEKSMKITVSTEWSFYRQKVRLINIVRQIIQIALSLCLIYIFQLLNFVHWSLLNNITLWSLWSLLIRVLLDTLLMQNFLSWSKIRRSKARFFLCAQLNVRLPLWFLYRWILCFLLPFNSKYIKTPFYYISF